MAGGSDCRSSNSLEAMDTFTAYTRRVRWAAMIHSMEFDSVARLLGFPSFMEYANRVRDEIAFGLDTNNRAREMLRFVTPLQAITPDEARLGFAFGLGNWEYLNQYCDGNALNREGTRLLLNVWEKADRASR